MTGLRAAVLLALATCVAGCGPSDVAVPTKSSPVGRHVEQPRAPSLRGRLTDPGGRPAAGARLATVPLPAFKGCPDARVETETAVGDDGEFAFADLAAGDWTLRCSKDGAVRALVAVVRVPEVARFDCVLPVGATIAGTLVDDATGQPVAGAKVWALADGGEKLTEATTSPEGKFEALTHRDGAWVSSFRIESPGRRARPVGYESDVVEPIGEGERMDVELRARRGAKLRGVVVGPAGPVAGARVTIWLDRGDGATPSPLTTTTDADGRYEAKDLDEGLATVRIESPGLVQPEARRVGWTAWEQWPASAPGECRAGVPDAGVSEHDVALVRDEPWPTCSASGRVIDEEDKPVAGATVSNAMGSAHVSTKTGPDGAFVLAGVPVDDESGEVVVEHAEFESVSTSVSATSDGNADDIEISLRRKPRVHGRVTTTAGAAVAGARVFVVAEGVLVHAASATSARDERSVIESRTDARGEFSTVFARRDGPLTARVDAPGLAAGFARRDRDDVRVDFDADFALDPATSLVGRVVEAGGATPVAGVPVIVLATTSSDGSDTDEGRPRPAAVRCVSGADGTFRLDGLPRGTQTLAVGGGTWIWTTAPVDLPRAEPLVVEVRTSLVIDGRVTSADGAPASDISVALYASSPDADVEPVLPPRRTKQGGRFVFRGVAPGKYWLEFTGGDPEIGRKVVGPVSAGTPAIPVRVEPGLAIEGSVEDADGRPVQGVDVWATPSGRTSTRRETTSTTPDGRFELTGLVDGAYDVHAAADGYLLVRASDVHAGGSSLELKLQAALAVDGVLLDPDGNPLGDVRISARAADAGASDPDWTLRATRTDEKGAFHIGSLAGGRWRIVLDEAPTYAGPRPPDDAVFDAGATGVTVRCVAGGAEKPGPR